MGEMADYANEIHQTECEELDEYYAGKMTTGESYERGIIDERGGVIQHPRPSDMFPFLPTRVRRIK